VAGAKAKGSKAKGLKVQTRNQVVRKGKISGVNDGGGGGGREMLGNAIIGCGEEPPFGKREVRER